MQPTRNLARWTLGGAILAGAVVSLYLIDVHVDVSAGADPAGALCNFGAGFDCSGAASSRFAKLFGVPVALWGLGFYVAAAMAWVFGVREPASERPPRQGAPGFLAALFLGACVYSLFLGLVSVVAIGSLCPACVTLYVVNAVAAVAAFRWAGGGLLGTVRAQIVAWRSGLARYGVPAAAVVGLVVATGMITIARIKPAPRPQVPVEVSADALALLQGEGIPSVGPADAPVVLVEFSDFECPYCSRLAFAVHDVQEQFANRLRVEFRQFPLPFHTHAAEAAAAALCAHEQGAFWAMHDAMFASQRSLDRNGLLDLARAAGIDADAVEACLDAGVVEADVARDIEAGRALGVEGTPTFFVNGRKYVGAVEMDALVAIVEEALGQPAEPVPDEGSD